MHWLRFSTFWILFLIKLKFQRSFLTLGVLVLSWEIEFKKSSAVFARSKIASSCHVHFHVNLKPLLTQIKHELIIFRNDFTKKILGKFTKKLVISCAKQQFWVQANKQVQRLASKTAQIKSNMLKDLQKRQIFKFLIQ